MTLVFRLKCVRAQVYKPDLTLWGKHQQCLACRTLLLYVGGGLSFELQRLSIDPHQNNTTLRHVPANRAAVVKQWVLHKISICICRFRYPACYVHTPYCHLWRTQLYNTSTHFLTNCTIFEKKLLNTKCVFWFSLQLLSETFLILAQMNEIW